MIFDSLKNFHLYIAINPLFRIALDFTRKENMAALAKGKITLANGVYAIVNEYETTNIQDTFIECHRKYIDIQVMVSGAEQIGICNKNGCKVSAAYDEKEDFEKLSGAYDLITLQEGYFVIFFPHDAHAPGLKMHKKSSLVKKIVFKIPV